MKRRTECGWFGVGDCPPPLFSWWERLALSALAALVFFILVAVGFALGAWLAGGV